MRCGILGVGRSACACRHGGIGRGHTTMGILAELWRDETAVMTAETALMVALLSLASFATWRQLARTVEGRADETSNIFQTTR